MVHARFMFLPVSGTHMSQSVLPLQTSVTICPLRHMQLATWNDYQCLVHIPEGEEYLCCSASLCQFRWLVWRAFSAQRGLVISSQIVKYTSTDVIYPLCKEAYH